MINVNKSLILIVLVAAVGGATLRKTISSQNCAAVGASPHDVIFGAVPEGTLVNRTVTLTNRTNKAVSIRKILTSCGCTTTSRLNSIPANAAADLQVRFNSNGRIGTAEKTIDVSYTSNGQAGDVLIKLHGSVKQFFSTKPPGGVDFGLLNKGEIRHQRVEVTRIDGAPFQTAGLTSSGNARVSDLHLSGSTATFDVGVKASLVAGPYSEFITIPFADGLPAYTVPVQYVIASLYHFSQPYLNFGVIPSHTFPVRTVVIVGPDLPKLSVARTPSYLEAQVSVVDRHHALLSVRYLGNGPSGSTLSSTIELQTKNSREPTLVLPEYAFVTKAQQRIKM